MTEDRGLRKLRETTTKAEAAERHSRGPAKDWQNIEQQPGVADMFEYPQSALPINRMIQPGKSNDCGVALS
jgi:hypothetical protein